MKLAIDGGTPVRETAPCTSFPGGSIYGEEEANEILKAVMARSPFRFYGFHTQNPFK